MCTLLPKKLHHQCVKRLSKRCLEVMINHDVKIVWIARFSGRTWQEVFEELDIPVEGRELFLLAQIQGILNEKDPTDHFGELIEMSDKIIESHNVKDMTELGKLLKTHKKRQKRGFPERGFRTFQQKRDRLGDALYFKGIVLMELLFPSKGKDSRLSPNQKKLTEKYNLDDLDQVIDDLKALSNSKNSKWNELFFFHALETWSIGQKRSILGNRGKSVRRSYLKGIRILISTIFSDVRWENLSTKL
ncbi:uncharacterized protein LOC141854333 [Brevipalpus obovatus]|uniref:uncharacterized protein LOC141854333 n=1 Tax=Brevipalpus obovatus TaxID=246614 RepID=UPI003D9E8FB9